MSTYETATPYGVIAAGSGHSIIPEGHHAHVRAETDRGAEASRWVTLAVPSPQVVPALTGVYRVECDCGWRGEHWDAAEFNRGCGRPHPGLFWPIWAPVFVEEWETHVTELLRTPDLHLLAAAADALHEATDDYRAAVGRARAQGVPWTVIADTSRTTVASVRYHGRAVSF